MVNAEFPDRAGYGFEMVDFAENRATRPPETDASRHRSESIRTIFPQISRELNRMQALAIYRGSIVRLSTARRP
jgi:hypothetical protein